MTKILEHSTMLVIKAKGFSQKEMYNSALSEMNQVMLPGYCESVTHYDCLMHLSLRSEDSVSLLEDFLRSVTRLSRTQNALFCYAHFDYLHRSGLKAQLFGRWYAHLENEIQDVSCRAGDLPNNLTELQEVPIHLTLLEVEHA